MATAIPAVQGSGGSFEIKSLWIGDLQPHTYLLGCFAHTGEVIYAKVINSRHTGKPKGYGFVQFLSHAAAESVLQSYNGTPIPNSNQNFRMNWATLGQGEKRPKHTIVGNLASDVTEVMLQEIFKTHYPSVTGAKIVMDKMTDRSKGYGFDRFGDENEQMWAMTEMNGMYCSSRPMRIGPAANKKFVTDHRVFQTEQSQWNGEYYGYPQGYEAYGYAPPAQVLSMYYGGYAGYNDQRPMSYQQPQQ